MKKNAMLKIAAILMVAVLLTTCAISSTFAKYVTTGAGSTQARVAKWGVTVNSSVLTSEKLFASTYANGTGTAWTTNALIMAPGTHGSIVVDNAIEGNPEVSGTITIKYYFTLSGDWTTDGNTAYCPIQIKAGASDAEFEYIPTSARAAAGETKSTFCKEYTVNFAPNDTLDAKIDSVLEWKWDFVNADDQKIDEQNVNDTKLADRAFAGHDSFLTVDIEIEVVQTADAAAATVAP